MTVNGRSAPAAPVAVLGECVADTFVVAATGKAEVKDVPAIGLDVLPGGGPANTAVTLSRLGTPTRFLGRLSGDVFGRLFREHLSASGVDLTGCVAAPEVSTLAVASVDAEGRAEYSFHAQGAADWQWTLQELAHAAATPVAAVHTGSLSLVQPPGGEAVEALLEEVRHRATVSIDPNVRPLLVNPAVYQARLPRWCAAADILRLSEDDLTYLLPGETLESAADRWHEQGVTLVVITLGGDGVFASLAGERLRVNGPRVTIADTVGAGDSFMGGLLNALHSAGALGGRLDGLHPEQLRMALVHATRVAAATCAVRGANPPWAGQIDDRLGVAFQRVS